MDVDGSFRVNSVLCKSSTHSHTEQVGPWVDTVSELHRCDLVDTQGRVKGEALSIPAVSVGGGWSCGRFVAVSDSQARAKCKSLSRSHPFYRPVPEMRENWWLDPGIGRLMPGT